MIRETISGKVLMNAVITVGAKNGLENIRTSSIAEEASISAGSIYKHFAGKDELIVEAFFMICDEIDKALQIVYEPNCDFWITAKKIWDAYYDYFYVHPNRAKYFNRFRYSAYMTHEIHEKHMQHFQFFINFLHTNMHKIAAKNTNPSMLGIFVVDTTVSIAIQAADGLMNMTADDKEQAFSMIMKIFT